MGGGASKGASNDEERLMEENRRLMEENRKLRQRLESSSTNTNSGETAGNNTRKDTRRDTGTATGEGGQGAVRRGEISAEVRKVSMIIANYKKVHVEKLKEIRDILSSAVEESLLFNSMGAEEKSECVDAFRPQNFNSNETIIRQNEVGDDFYIVTSGTVEVMVKKSSAAKRATSKGTLSKGQSFGELALLYNTPRAATIIAQTNVSLWVLPRSLFVNISTYFKYQRQNLYVTFLKKVEVFESMAHEKLIRVAEALESEKHVAGEPIILQGERGDHFYLIAKGSVTYKVRDPDTKEQRDVGDGNAGDFFGDKCLTDENDKRTASVYAVTDVELLCMERAMFHKLMKGLESQLLTPEQKATQLRDATKVGEKFRRDIPLEQLTIMRTLGEGAFGRVRLVKHKESGLLYALKYLSKKHITDGSSEAHVINERNIMMSVDNPFILQLHNTYQDSRYLYFLLELIRGGELFTLLRDLIQLSEKTARFYAAGVIQGFNHMHNHDIVYRDLKPENLLLNKHGYIKIVDLGLAKLVPDRTWTLCGTPEYLAPEVILNKGHDRAVDNWALGILIYEMVAGSAPFEGDSSMQVYTQILKGDLLYSSAFSRSCRGIIGAMLTQNPKRRLGYTSKGYEDVRRHHWYAGFDWTSFIALTLPAPHTPTISGDNDLSNFDQYAEVNVMDVPESNWYPDFGTRS